MGAKGPKRELTPAQIKAETELAQLVSDNERKTVELADMGAQLNPLALLQLKIDCVMSYSLSPSKQRHVARKYGEHLGELLDSALESAPAQQAAQRLHLPA